MKAQDWMSQDNNRAEAVRRLIELCERVNLDFKYTEKKFTITLPDVEELPVSTGITKTRKTFDISKWGETGIVEGVDNLPDELPETTTPLEEGEPPKGDDEK